MSHYVADGSRVSKWGHSYGSVSCAARKQDGTRDTAYRPSHKIGQRLGRGSTKGRCLGKRHVSSGHDANGDPVTEVSYLPPVLANPGNLVKCLVGGGVMGDKECHANEAPFPEALADRFIRSFCPPDGLVLDPFSGSGTTGAAAIKCGRRYLGIDIRESQIQLASKRLAKFMPLFQEQEK